MSGLRVLDLLGLLVLDLLFFDFSPGDLGDLDLVGLLDLILDLLGDLDLLDLPGHFEGVLGLAEGLDLALFGTVLSVFLLFRDLFRDSLSLAILAVWVLKRSSR